MARLIGLFAASVLLVLGTSLIVGHFRQRAIIGQLAEINGSLTSEPIEHRSVGTRDEQNRSDQDGHQRSHARASQKHELPESGRTHTSLFDPE